MFHDDRMKILEYPTTWMFAVVERGRSNRPKTWIAYAEDLLDFLRVCEANEWDLMRPLRGQLAAYRDQLQTRLIKRLGYEKPLSIGTINRRLHTAMTFYLWLKQEGLVSELPFRLEERRIRPADTDALAHARRTTSLQNNVTLPPAPERTPVALKMHEITAILGALSERDELIAAIALSTGAREDEILSLNVDQIPNSQRYSSEKSVPITLFKTKGLKQRDLYIPLPILIRLTRYIYGERARIVRDCLLRGEAADPKAVFLTIKGQRYAARSIQKTFRAAADSARSSAVFHDLRHTFAIYRLVQLRQAPIVDHQGRSADPLITLKALLGHSKVTTTFKYLRALDSDPHQAEDAMLNWVNEWSQRASV